MKKEENKKTEEKVVKKVQKTPQRVVSFRVYFQELVRQNKVDKHHEEPMKVFAKSKGMENASFEEFDRLFRTY